MRKNPEFEDWVSTVPETLRNDALWKSVYYRLAMYLYDLAWEDTVMLKKDFRGREISKQLIRSAGSVCANLEEAYGRGVGTPDHLRMIRISLGEARETKGWYLRSRHLLEPELIEKRLDIIGQIIALLIGVVSK